MDFKIDSFQDESCTDQKLTIPRLELLGYLLLAVLINNKIIYDEVCEPLTPSHLEIGRRLQLINVIRQFSKDNVDAYTARLKYLNIIIDHYWKRFRREYIAQLSERHFYERKRQKIDNT